MAFDIKKLTGREKNIVGILLTILATMPFFYLTLPSWNNYNDLSSKIQNNQNKLKDTNRQIQKLENLKSENLNLFKKVESQKQYLAKSYEIDFLVEDLKKICDESSISLESFTPSTSEPINIVLEKQLESESQNSPNNFGNYKQALEKLKGKDLPIDLYRFPIEVKVTGDFTDLLELFKKLEKYGRVISVENISIGKIEAKQAFQDRLSKAKQKKEETSLGSLYSSFDLVAYSAAKEDETISFSQLKKSIGSTGKFTFKSRKHKL